MDSEIQIIDKCLEGREPNETCFMRKMADMGKEKCAVQANCNRFLLELEMTQEKMASTTKRIQS
jgi:hypothetical protein